jgi:glutamate N-acetyltransferase/amino-acid N-acetyltransferase
MTTRVPRGFRLAAVHCGLKSDPARPDLTLIACDRDATAAGVYTQNRFCAAPVLLDRGRTPGTRMRAVVANSGNANACTGEQGLRDAREMAQLTAQACGIDEAQVLVLSTGVIGEPLPMLKISAGIAAAAAQLDADDPALVSAARGLMTTDAYHKLAARQLQLAGQDVCLAGLAKGAGMIGPNMATMLAILLTDAALAPEDAQRLLSTVVDETFNCISVEGHTSTNDTVLLLASGAAHARPLEGADLAAFAGALQGVCGELARAIPNDGEGATHLIQIEVRGCARREDARRIAREIANSPLVKTAAAGGDPNWGRIVSAAGNAGVEFQPGRVDLSVNGCRLFQQGAPVAFDAAAVSASIRANRQTDIVVQLGEGDCQARFWTSDLTAEYVRINSDYHT